MTHLAHLTEVAQRLFDADVPYSDAVQQFKKALISVALDSNHGNQCKAARDLKMHRNSVTRIKNDA